MPRVNIYIRKDNEDRWSAIIDKSAWVNDRLRGLPEIPNNAVAKSALYKAANEMMNAEQPTKLTPRERLEQSERETRLNRMVE